MKLQHVLTKDRDDDENEDNDGDDDDDDERCCLGADLREPSEPRV